jgi:hypothetical protein
MHARGQIHPRTLEVQGQRRPFQSWYANSTKLEGKKAMSSRQSSFRHEYATRQNPALRIRHDKRQPSPSGAQSWEPQRTVCNLPHVPIDTACSTGYGAACSRDGDNCKRGLTGNRSSLSSIRRGRGQTMMQVPLFDMRLQYRGLQKAIEEGHSAGVTIRSGDSRPGGSRLRKTKLRGILASAMRWVAPQEPMPCCWH